MTRFTKTALLIPCISASNAMHISPTGGIADYSAALRHSLLGTYPIPISHSGPRLSDSATIHGEAFPV